MIEFPTLRKVQGAARLKSGLVIVIQKIHVLNRIPTVKLRWIEDKL